MFCDNDCGTGPFERILSRGSLLMVHAIRMGMDPTQAAAAEPSMLKAWLTSRGVNMDERDSHEGV